MEKVNVGSSMATEANGFGETLADVQQMAGQGFSEIGGVHFCRFLDDNVSILGTFESFLSKYHPNSSVFPSVGPISVDFSTKSMILEPDFKILVE